MIAVVAVASVVPGVVAVVAVVPGVIAVAVAEVVTLVVSSFVVGADERIPSLLVFEVSDSITIRHIVALSTAHAGKLRRHFSNAKKLHIYNDHCFVATHFKK